MTSQGRIVLLYRKGMRSAAPERLLAALDERYPDRDVMDLGLDLGAPGLDEVHRHIRGDDVVLMLVDSESEVWHRDAEERFASACTLRIAVDDASNGAGLVVSTLTWEADVERLLGELDLRFIVGPTGSDDGVGDDDDLDQLFDEAARLQKGGMHQDAVDLFQTIIDSDTPGLSGPAAYAAARSYEKLRDSNHAVQAYRRAISLGPRDAGAAAAYGLGRLLARRREFAEAAAAYAKAVKLGDTSMRARAEDRRNDALRRAAEA